mgnify:CR=1 FL=1
MISVSRVADRLWGVDAEDRGRIWYTKPIVPGYAPEWNAANTLFVPNALGATWDEAGIGAYELDDQGLLEDQDKPSTESAKVKGASAAPKNKRAGRKNRNAGPTNYTSRCCACSRSCGGWRWLFP